MRHSVNVLQRSSQTIKPCFHCVRVCVAARASVGVVSACSNCRCHIVVPTPGNGNVRDSLTVFNISAHVHSC